MIIIGPNGLDLSLIAPERGAKYSPNLYRWLSSKRNSSRSWNSRVYCDTSGEMWIGLLDGRELFGSKLISVLCNGAIEDTAAWQNIDVVEISDFWALYVADGRCAIDPMHCIFFTDDATRWSVSGDTRACQWCGKASQTMKRWTESVQREQWVNV